MESSLERLFTHRRVEYVKAHKRFDSEGTALIRRTIYRLFESEFSVVAFMTGSWLMEMLDSAVLATLKW